MKCRQLLVNLLERLDASNPATSLTAYESKVEIVSDHPDSPPEAISFSLKEPLSITDELNKAIKRHICREYQFDVRRCRLKFEKKCYYSKMQEHVVTFCKEHIVF